jgi:hypothetical protein
MWRHIATGQIAFLPFHRKDSSIINDTGHKISGQHRVGPIDDYTCFRSMDWAANIPDFWQPLRDLKAKKYFIKNDNGEYEINHIGLGFVKKLGGSNGAD